MARPRSIDEGRILRAAREVFVARGAEATTREVADAAGVSQAVLFQRYGTKRRLFFAAMLPRPPRLDALLGEPPEGTPEAARAYLVGLAARFLDWLDASMPGSLRAALHPAFPRALDDAHAPAGADELERAVAARLREMQLGTSLSREADVDAAAVTLIELLHGQALAVLLSDVDRATAAERAERAVALLWDGLAPAALSDAPPSGGRVRGRGRAAPAPSRRRRDP